MLEVLEEAQDLHEEVQDLLRVVEGLQGVEAQWAQQGEEEDQEGAELLVQVKDKRWQMILRLVLQLQMS